MKTRQKKIKNTRNNTEKTIMRREQNTCDNTEQERNYKEKRHRFITPLNKIYIIINQ